MGNRLWLVVAAALFLGWIGYLGYAALSKGHTPVVSHVQAAVAEAAVVAELTGDGPPDQIVKVVERLDKDGPEGPVEILNLSTAKGYVGPGPYLLYLVPRHDRWFVVGTQRSPGYDLTGGPALIYPWGDAVRKQAAKLKGAERQKP